jgi:glycosyltransferase involved in cell wall biosynthesis
VFPAADVFAMPTHAEGFGFTNVEALSFGLPVITTRVGPAEEIVEDGVCGRLVPAGDVDALADALRDLAADGPGRRSMGAAGRERFLDRFTLERMQTEIAAVYDAALSS